MGDAPYSRHRWERIMAHSATHVEAARLVALDQRIQQAGHTDGTLPGLLTEYAPALLAALDLSEKVLPYSEAFVRARGLPSGIRDIVLYVRAEPAYVGCFIQDDLEASRRLPWEPGYSGRARNLLNAELMHGNPEIHDWLRKYADLRTHALHPPAYPVRIFDDSDTKSVWSVLTAAKGDLAVDALAGAIMRDLMLNADEIADDKGNILDFHEGVATMVRKDVWVEREYLRALRSELGKARRVPAPSRAQLIATEARLLEADLPPPHVPTYIFAEWPGMSPAQALVHYLVKDSRGPRLSRKAAGKCLQLQGFSVRDHLRRASKLVQAESAKALGLVRGGRP